MSDRAHWDGVYSTKPTDGVSWYAPHLAQSLDLITHAAPDRAARILDVGGGASTLVDDLLDLGYRHLTVLDLSAAALDAARARLGARADQVTWLVGDVTTAALGTYDVWHDRAVFHFLTDGTARARYVAQCVAAVPPGGHVIVATFGPDGPERCSGLPVVRYDADGLHAAFGAPFVKTDAREETHTTPWGAAQAFIYCVCVRAPAP